jgi:malonyl-CoA decarboxylase
VVEELRRDLPRIESFVTLSPMPGFRAWLETTDDPAVEALAAEARQRALDENWAANPESAARARKALEPLAAYYLLKARRPDGRVIDSVARFHLGNGARLERINWLGDLSVKGLFESYGVMVNYLYDLAEIERNHEAFANQGVVAASSAAKKLLPGAKARTSAPALPAPGA